MNRPAKSLVLQWDKCVEAEPAYNCDDILNAVALLTQEAEEGDLQAQMNEDRHKVTASSALICHKNQALALEI